MPLPLGLTRYLITPLADRCSGYSTAARSPDVAWRQFVRRSAMTSDVVPLRDQFAIEQIFWPYPGAGSRYLGSVARSLDDHSLDSEIDGVDVYLDQPDLLGAAVRVQWGKSKTQHATCAVSQLERRAALSGRVPLFDAAYQLAVSKLASILQSCSEGFPE